MSNNYPTDIQNDLSERHLDIEKVLELDESQQKIIIKLFDDLLDCFSGERGMSLPGGFKVDYLGAQVLYTTLSEGGFLVTRREKNLNEILE